MNSTANLHNQALHLKSGEMDEGQTYPQMPTQGTYPANPLSFSEGRKKLTQSSQECIYASLSEMVGL